jgi:hypothetical protein
VAVVVAGVAAADLLLSVFTYSPAVLAELLTAQVYTMVRLAAPVVARLKMPVLRLIPVVVYPVKEIWVVTRKRMMAAPLTGAVVAVKALLVVIRMAVLAVCPLLRVLQRTTQVAVAVRRTTNQWARVALAVAVTQEALTQLRAHQIQAAAVAVADSFRALQVVRGL